MSPARAHRQATPTEARDDLPSPDFIEARESAYLTSASQSGGMPAEERFWSNFRDATLGVALLDPTGQIRVGNEAFIKLLGYTADELPGMLLMDLSHPMDRNRDGRLLSDMAEGGAGSVSAETRFLCKTGALVWVKLCLHRMPDGEGGPEMVVAIVEDLSSGWEAAETLHRLSTTDELTGLLNRRGFQLFAEQQWRIARRKARELVLLYIDVDGLKGVNDRLGHSVGDDLLRETADILRHLCRDTDVVARIGGDEFVILAVEAMQESVALFRTRIERVLAERNGRPGRAFQIAFSLGAAHFGPETQLTIEALLSEADSRMYACKQGKGAPSEAPSRSAPPTPATPRGPAAAASILPALPATRVQYLTTALREIIAIALGDAAHAERIARIHRCAVAALVADETLG